MAVVTANIKVRHIYGRVTAIKKRRFFIAALKGVFSEEVDHHYFSLNQSAPYLWQGHRNKKATLFYCRFKRGFFGGGRSSLFLLNQSAPYLWQGHRNKKATLFYSPFERGFFGGGRSSLFLPKSKCAISMAGSPQ